jgi:cytochrome b561
MTSIANTKERFGAAAMLLHWSMAFLIIGLAALGLYMVTLPDVGFNTKKIVLILFHKEVGLLVLVLLAARLAWRVTHILPQLVAHLPDWQQIAARFVHLCFYALMFALPMTGWLMSSAAGIPVSFFGLLCCQISSPMTIICFSDSSISTSGSVSRSSCSYSFMWARR